MKNNYDGRFLIKNNTIKTVEQNLENTERQKLLNMNFVYNKIFIHENEIRTFFGKGEKIHC